MNDTWDLKPRRSLVIYGNAHFGMPGIPVELGPVNFLRDVLEQDHPHAFFIVMACWGFLQKGCSTAFEDAHTDWRTPALAFPVRGSTIGDALSRTGCDVETTPQVSFTLPNKTAAELAELRAKFALAARDMVS